MCCSKSFKVVTERNSRQQITCHNFRIHLQIKGKEALRVELDLTTQLLTSLGKVLTFRSSQIFSFSSFISGAPKTPEYSTPAKDFITFMFFSSASSVQRRTAALQPSRNNLGAAAQGAKRSSLSLNLDEVTVQPASYLVVIELSDGFRIVVQTGQVNRKPRHDQPAFKGCLPAHALLDGHGIHWSTWLFIELICHCRHDTRHRACARLHTARQHLRY